MEKEKLRKMLFVDASKYEKEKLENLIERLSVLCKVGEDGIVYFPYDNIMTKDRILLMFLARLLANKIDDNIDPVLEIGEISDSCLIPQNQVSARVFDLEMEGLVAKVNRGAYKLIPFYVSKALRRLERRYAEKIRNAHA